MLENAIEGIACHPPSCSVKKRGGAACNSRGRHISEWKSSHTAHASKKALFLAAGLTQRLLQLHWSN